MECFQREQDDSFKIHRTNADIEKTIENVKDKRYKKYEGYDISKATV